ncbi:DNA repair protein RecN [Bifidobacterium aemilianum]|uniref:DNA repair protein RecN n=1 Tax=Bifidobacterium aemilianum TaxID=2493120 RepID=A0A366K8Q3_9BIFI|nr:DNA repair protein RecN [Bifidobacterium aemilianum]RBP98096.1 DNA repair protein RecN [Bifidobacterium aemilianum]
MLEELELRDLGPIRQARIAPAAGMTAITGETGAGKSMLLNAIRLISGGDADSGLVTAGSQQAWVQGIFTMETGCRAAHLAREAGADLEGEEHAQDKTQTAELFLARSMPASGRSRAMLDGHTVPKSVLAEISAELITIHGQSDQLRIASPARQREFLDMVAGNAPLVASYSQDWEALKAMDERLARLRSQEVSARQRASYLRDAIGQIDKVDPKPGEEAELRERRDRIENAAQINQGLAAALSALDSSQMDLDAEGAGAVDLINRAISSLRSIGVGDFFDQTADRLQSINADLSDMVFSLAGQMDQEEGIEDLDSLNSRIHALSELTRQWGPDLEDVIKWREQAAFEIEDLDASPEKLAELDQDRHRLFDQAMKSAQALHDRREQAARELAATVSQELDSLAMSGSRLDIRVSARKAQEASAAGVSGETSGPEGQGGTWPLDAHGLDDIEFLFTPFPGSPQLPMGKSASGGELSRLMLAMELAAAGKASSPQGMTFIFDEVDAGVGGKAAVELGKRLAKLAQSAQVIVVTHLPQVASWAKSQFVVSKGQAGADEAVSTSVTEVGGEDRVREIARMLSGSESATSLDHARELLDSTRL